MKEPLWRIKNKLFKIEVFVMATPNKNDSKNDIEAEEPRISEDETKTTDIKIFSYGFLYSIGIIIILFIILSFLFLSEEIPEVEEGEETEEIMISRSDYPNFFMNDSPHFPNGSTEVFSDRCLICHDSTGDDIIFQFQSLKIANSTDLSFATKCFQCHVEPKHKVQLPYNICTECHYQKDHEALSLSFNYILETLGEIDNSFCIECHEHECTELDKVGHTHEDVCTNCHNDHKRIPGCLDCHDPTFIGPYHDLRSPNFEICTDCHMGGAHTRPIINDNMDCSICHTNIYATTLENYGGRHYTNETLGKCSNCHTDHKEYPSCRDCHGTFPEHLWDKAVENPNQECTVCHEGGAHDSRVNYKNYYPELGDRVCQVCHDKEYTVYYEKTTPPERELYGNCLNCHEEHNTQVKIPHITPDKFLDCGMCHEGYSGPKTMHVISNTSYSSFPYDEIPDEFCSNCHNSEYSVFNNYMTPEFKNSYGDACTDCHDEHKEIPGFHRTESPFDQCVSCHETYNDTITIHNPMNITYELFTEGMNNEFCSDCHLDQYNGFTTGSHSNRLCADCHVVHRTVSVDFNDCTACHSAIPSTHNEDLSGCHNCHNTSDIHR
jgi:hypothetical protein